MPYCRRASEYTSGPRVYQISQSAGIARVRSGKRARTTHNIERLHFHQGFDYRYGAWQPVHGKKQASATRAPYYGHIMVASTIASSDNTRIVKITL
ncbi:hypothetical protein N7463_005714 [Penicillium fimorum]|uniref:Uncharacterized protein n=1 Tax=Penicillium fimorum TaxID=1882269 RepID=A0A9W9XT11_9EURO|nr:hypothetical protein N7463_005714 [Penicillium fimorum]